MDVMKKVPVREQDPKVRATNFDEVCLGYNAQEAQAEASRCLKCKNARCVSGCPVAIDIPGFIAKVQEGAFEEAADIIALSSALPAVCGRVCPQESQCEGKCVRGIKGEPISIGKLERFVADWSREHGFVSRALRWQEGGCHWFRSSRTHLRRRFGQVGIRGDHFLRRSMSQAAF